MASITAQALCLELEELTDTAELQSQQVFPAAACHQLTTAARLRRLLLQIGVAAAAVQQLSSTFLRLVDECTALGVDLTPLSRTPGVEYYVFGAAAHAVTQLRWVMGQLALARTALEEAEAGLRLTNEAISELDFSCMCMRSRRRSVARHRCLVCFGWSF